MPLNQYNKKRSFEATPEPTGGKPGSRSLRFVVQKHHASRLHYDFRLEMDGVLKSWAVPKGPSLNPADKRLAMEVEDHPYDYRDFEGIIPEGNYGAGSVIVWDTGTYQPIEPVKGGKAARKKLLLKQLKDGNLKFKLKGKKLQGEFALVRTKGMGDNAWLLIKHKDEFAGKKDVTKQDRSTKSGKTLEEIAATSRTIYKSGSAKNGGKSKASASQKKEHAKPVAEQLANAGAPASKKRINESEVLKKATRKAFPKFVAPMLATLVDEPFDDDGWEYEVKWDGYRATAYLHKDEVALFSRNQKPFEEKFYPVYNALKEWKIDAVVDGEIVAIDDAGKAAFSRLQNWRSEADGELCYYVFDILWLDGKDLTNLPLHARKALLEKRLPKNSLIRSGFSVQAKGREFFKVATQMGLEGIISKKSNSIYQRGERSNDWLKIKVQQRQEVVIAGYTCNDNSSKAFSSLLLGYFEKGKLKYAGKVGTGFKDKKQKELLKTFKPLTRKTSPFDVLPDYNKASRFRPVPPNTTVTWLKPELVCEIHFAEITEDGVFRHPAFVAMREDKQAKDVVRETPTNATKAAPTKASAKNSRKILKPVKGSRKTLLNSTDKSQVRDINGNEVQFTNLDKIYWPDEGYTKRDLINYYYQIAPFMLPYLKDRPQSLNRFPNGIKGKSFYQKDVTGKVPGWVDKYPYKSKDDNKKKNYMLGNDEAALLYMANAGAIEMNPWSSTIKKPEHPDWCILDLDPDKGNTFDQVIETANVIKEILDKLNVPSYCKTSGSTGLHIYIPLGAKYEYEQSQLFAQWIASEASQQLDFTSIERMTKKRKGKIYIDYLQNRSTATLAAPYSVRPKPGATVSMPLDWAEVKPGLSMQDFTIENAVARVQKMGDLFKPVLGKGVHLKKILKKI